MIERQLLEHFARVLDQGGITTNRFVEIPSDGRLGEHDDLFFLQPGDKILSKSEARIAARSKKAGGASQPEAKIRDVVAIESIAY